MATNARKTTSLYVQWGCGLCAPEGWLNFDASPTLRFERLPIVGMLYTRNSRRFPATVRYGDILKGLPVPPASCRGVYTSHAVEHLTHQDALTALTNSARLLAPGGILRVVVPDLESAAKRYTAALDQGAVDANLTFLRATSLGRDRKRPGLLRRVGELLSNSAHLWMWDAHSLMATLESIGLTAVRKCRFNDCEDSMFRSVEDEHRFADAVAVEARR